MKTGFFAHGVMKIRHYDLLRSIWELEKSTKKPFWTNDQTSLFVNIKFSGKVTYFKNDGKTL